MFIWSDLIWLLASWRLINPFGICHAMAQQPNPPIFNSPSMVPNMCLSPAEPGFPRDVWWVLFFHLWCSNTPLHLQWPNFGDAPPKGKGRAPHFQKWGLIWSAKSQRPVAKPPIHISRCHHSSSRTLGPPSLPSQSVCIEEPGLAALIHEFHQWSLSLDELFSVTFTHLAENHKKKGQCHGRSPMLAAFLQWIKMGWPPSKNSLARTS